MAGTSGFFSNGPFPWMDNDTEMNNLYRDLELGTVLTLFYSKKSQRPERRTFQVKLETRTIIWTRGTDKIEGESEYKLSTACECVHARTGWFTCILTYENYKVSVKVFEQLPEHL